MLRDELYALPLDDFIHESIRLNDFPPKDSWRSPLWEFVRLVKGRREFAKLGGYDVARTLDIVLRRIATGCVASGDDQWDYHFGNLDAVGDPRAEFIDSWDKVRTPANMDALCTAWQSATEFPLGPRREYSNKYCEFLSLAGHLQHARPDKEIALPVERIAAELKCDRKSVGMYLKFAIKEGLLARTSECVPLHRAAEYRFAIERFDWVSGKQIS